MNVPIETTLATWLASDPGCMLTVSLRGDWYTATAQPSAHRHTGSCQSRDLEAAIRAAIEQAKLSVEVASRPRMPLPPVSRRERESDPIGVRDGLRQSGRGHLCRP